MEATQAPRAAAVWRMTKRATSRSPGSEEKTAVRTSRSMEAAGGPSASQMISPPSMTTAGESSVFNSCRSLNSISGGLLKSSASGEAAGRLRAAGGVRCCEGAY